MKIMVMTHLPKEGLPLNQPLEEFQDFIKKDYASPGTENFCCFREELLGGAIHSRQRGSKALSGFEVPTIWSTNRRSTLRSFYPSNPLGKNSIRTCRNTVYRSSCCKYWSSGKFGSFWSHS